MIDLIAQNPLFFAFFFPAIVDGLITLLGQNTEYWKKSDRTVNEASPAYYFLKMSPWVFVLGSVFWFVLWYYLFTFLPRPVNIFISILFISGHSWGSSSWIMKMFREKRVYTVGNQLSVMKAWSFLILYFCLISYFATYSFLVYFTY